MAAINQQIDERYDKVIRNASRFLTGEAQTGAIVTNSSDNSKTYNSNVSSTIQVPLPVRHGCWLGSTPMAASRPLARRSGRSSCG